MNESVKTRETRLRRMAKRQGLEIRKSRIRDPYALGYDRWMIVNTAGRRHGGTVVAGVSSGRPDFTLDDVEEYLTTPWEER